MSWKPYAVFSVIYFTLGMALSFLVELVAFDPIAFDPLVYVLELACWVAAAPVAIVLAKRVGCISTSGLVLAGTALLLFMYCFVWAEHQWQSVQAGASVPIWHMARIGGWPFALHALLLILAPPIWHSSVWRNGRRQVADAA